VEGKDLRKGSHKELLGASPALTLLACPITNFMGARGIDNRIGYRLLKACWDDRELNHGIPMVIRVIAVLTLDDIGDLEPKQLIKERNLIAKELQELVRVADIIPRGHIGRRLNTLVKATQTLVALGCPNFIKANFDGIFCVGFLVLEPRLKIGNSVDRLKSCIYPTASTGIAKTKGLHLSI
jgi:hypothetical protein